MSQAHKRCPICDAPNHRNAALCSMCGAALKAIQTVPEDRQNVQQLGYNDQFGETDLSEAKLHWRGGTLFVGSLLIVVLSVCAALVMLAGINLANQIAASNNAPGSTPTPVPTDNLNDLILTNTPRPTLYMPTVTLGSPTRTVTPSPTVTPTQGPCLQEVQPDDSLIAIIYRCGYRSIDNIMDMVVELNDLEDASHIQPGQVIQVPWPTVTDDPNLRLTPTSSELMPGDVRQPVETDSGDASANLSQSPATETLQAGVTWHQVQANENILAIAYNYGANLKILSELNPEVTFSQCDLGSGSGGPTCIVQLYEGQLLRVPAPTPTPTLSLTPSGSETPTPSVTPTFNAPSLISPDDRAFFHGDDLITLRWVTSGTLGSNETYLVRVEEQTNGTIYTETTRELYFVVPQTWRGQNKQRYDYQWSVSVINLDFPDDPIFVTEPRLFTWQGREGGS